VILIKILFRKCYIHMLHKIQTHKGIVVLTSRGFFSDCYKWKLFPFWHLLSIVL